ncbi:translation initiation inhibitor [Kocuria sp. WRN011]|uniref:RidA family protein n=1 Tax=Kocuria sp. WRN011 TaxID=2029858 RepID=UPI000BAFADCF|nr:RidA family protein [Kocuria sp. WRN011]PBB07328.1 translation initiation inhibitor [Kocuria sp. WRN011]
MPRRQRIVPSCLPAHVADNNAYSYGVLDGDTLHVPGMVAFAPDGSYVGEGNITAQATQVFDNLQAVVVEAGGTLEDVVSTTTYLASADYAGAVGEVRKKYFTGDVPPTSTVVVAPMAREQFMVEVSAIARTAE